MNRKLLRVTALLLAAMMLALSLAACGGDTNKPDDDGNNAVNGNSGNNGNGNGSSGDKSYADFVYTAAYQKVKNEEGIQSMDNLVYANGKLYMIAWIITGKQVDYYDEEWNLITDEEKIANGEYAEKSEYDKSEAALCSMNLDGSEFKKLENFVQSPVPEGSQGNSYINNMCVDSEGNVWIAEEVYAYHYDENNTYYDDGTQYIVRKLDATGAEIAKVDLSKITEGQEYFYINNFTVDEDGVLYLTGGNEAAVYVINSDGTLLFTQTIENGWISRLVKMKDGAVAVMVSEEGKSGYVLKTIDKTAKAFGGKDIPVPYGVYNLISGGGDYDFYYNDGYALYGYEAEKETATQLVNWINSDINSNDLQSITPLEDGRILAISHNWRSGGSAYEIVTLTKADPSTIPEKEILTFACMWLDYNMRAKIIDFNKTSDKYRINVVDYSTFNTEDDYTAGQTKLTTEIISGQVPDILATSNLPLTRYIARGLIEDLKPYIESDPELGADALVPGAMKALEVNGGIYQAASTFTIQTVVGASNIVGDKMGWTIDDLQAALAKMPEGASAFGNMTRENILYYICMMNQNDYVDWITGKCDFNNESFIKLLEFVKSFPAEINYDDDTEYVSEYKQIMDGKVMLSYTSVADFDEFQVYKTVYGGDITFVGFPTAEGSGSVANFSDGLAMSSTCKNKDAAWSFIRFLFTEDYQFGDSEGASGGISIGSTSAVSMRYSGWGFPTNQKAFDRVVKQAMEKQMGKDENGNEIEISHGSWWVDDGIEVQMYAATQEDVDMIMDLINNVDSAVSFDQDIYDIISEEVQPFFEGQKTAQDVAGIIQSRVTIYVNEQK